MGADLCGFCLFGPHTLERERVDFVLGRYAGLRRDIELLVQKHGQPSEWRAHLSVALEALAERLARTSFSHGSLEEDLQRVRELPEDLVQQFVHLWNEGGARDMMTSDLPLVLDPERTWRVLVAGERTWGEGPEEGSAWWTCEMMDHLGLLEPLGVL